MTSGNKFKPAASLSTKAPEYLYVVLPFSRNCSHPTEIVTTTPPGITGQLTVCGVQVHRKDVKFLKSTWKSMVYMTHAINSHRPDISPIFRQSPRIDETTLYNTYVYEHVSVPQPNLTTTPPRSATLAATSRVQGLVFQTIQGWRNFF